MYTTEWLLLILGRLVDLINATSGLYIRGLSMRLPFRSSFPSLLPAMRNWHELDMSCGIAQFTYFYKVQPHSTTAERDKRCTRQLYLV